MFLIAQFHSITKKFFVYHDFSAEWAKLKDQQQHKREQKRLHYQLSHIIDGIFVTVTLYYSVLIIVFTVYIHNTCSAWLILWNEAMLTTAVQVNYWYVVVHCENVYKGIYYKWISSL